MAYKDIMKSENKSDLKNILKKRSDYHKTRQYGLSPFCSLGEGMENGKKIYFDGMKLSDIYKTIRRVTFDAEPGDSLVVKYKDNAYGGDGECRMTQSYTPGQWKYKDGNHRGWYTTENACMFLSYTARDHRDSYLEIIKGNEGENMKLEKLNEVNLTEDNVEKLYHSYKDIGKIVRLKNRRGYRWEIVDFIERHYNSYSEYQYRLKDIDMPGGTAVCDCDDVELVPTPKEQPKREQPKIEEPKKDASYLIRKYLTPNAFTDISNVVNVSNPGNWHSDGAIVEFTYNGKTYYLDVQGGLTNERDKVWIREFKCKDTGEYYQDVSTYADDRGYKYGTLDLVKLITTGNWGNSNPISTTGNRSSHLADSLDRTKLNEAQTYQYDEDALAQFISEIPRNLEGAFKAFGYDLQTAHLKDLRKDFTNIFENILRRLRSLARVCFDEYDENDLTNAYIANGKNNGNFHAFTHYLIRQITDEQWEEVETDDPCKYVLENCKNDGLYLIRGYKGAQKVSAQKYVNSEMFGNRSHTVGIGSAQSVHHYSGKLVKDRAGNIGVIQSYYIYDSLNSVRNKTTLTESADTWMLIKTDKYYDPEGLDIEPQGKVLCRGTERECRDEFSKYVIKARQDSAREAERAKRNHHAPFIRLEKLDLYSLVICYPHAQAKDVYQLIPCNETKSVDNAINLNEDHMIQNYKGYELDWDRDGIDPEEGTANFSVYIRKNGKEITGKNGSVLTFNGFRHAREWIDKNTHKCSGKDKLYQLKALWGFEDEKKYINVAHDGNCYFMCEEYDSEGDIWRLYLDDSFNYAFVPMTTDDLQDVKFEIFDWLGDDAGEFFEISDEGKPVDFKDIDVVSIVDYYYTPFKNQPIELVSERGLNQLAKNLNWMFGFSLSGEALEAFCDEYDCSVPTNLTEAKKKQKKKPFDSINKNAGNVEHNINMFNMASNPVCAPCNNPVSGPMGGNVCCESIEPMSQDEYENFLKESAVECYRGFDILHSTWHIKSGEGKEDVWDSYAFIFNGKFFPDEVYDGLDSIEKTRERIDQIIRENPGRFGALEYDREAATKFEKEFDVMSPQEVADNFGREVKDGDDVYSPKKKYEGLDDDFDMFMRGI